MPEMDLHLFFFFRHPDLVNVPKGATPRIILINYEYWPDCKMLISAQLMILAPGNLFSMVSSPTHSLYVNRARGRLESTHNRRAPSADSQFIHSINVSKFVPHPSLSIYPDKEWWWWSWRCRDKRPWQQCRARSPSSTTTRRLSSGTDSFRYEIIPY